MVSDIDDSRWNGLLVTAVVRKGWWTVVHRGVVWCGVCVDVDAVEVVSEQHYSGVVSGGGGGSRDFPLASGVSAFPCAVPLTDFGSVGAEHTVSSYWCITYDDSTIC
jgi:hypothetical protein